MQLVDLRPLDVARILPLVETSEAEGFRFLRRLPDEYLVGETLFDGPGETLLGVVTADGQLIAVGGLTRVSTAARPTGRLRRVYVLPEARGQGVGRRLVAGLLEAAAEHFETVELRTDTVRAARFYEGLGFQPVTEATATHRVELEGRASIRNDRER